MSWIAVPGFVGEYAVSDDGRVMSMNFARSGDNRGEKHSQAKLTEAKVYEILGHLQAGRNAGDLGREYGVHPSQISHIKSGRSWPHLSRKAG